MVTTLDDKTLRIELGRDSYNLNFGTDLFQLLGEHMREGGKSKFIILTDENVAGEGYLDKMRDALSFAKQVDHFISKPGEKYKTQHQSDEICNFMDRKGHERKSVLIALGGGVTGDVGGYSAGTFLRGIGFIQYPTTTLAQADSSIGGKTGVDTEVGKNRRGIIYHPDADYIDLNTLETLNETHFISGLGEWVKHAALGNPEYFNYLEANVDKILARDLEVLMKCAIYNAQVKGSVVEIDTYEQGLRKTLNLGHTPGHAIEHLVNKRLAGDEIYPHGYGVSIGMVIVGRISAASPFTAFDEAQLSREIRLLEAFGLPTKIPEGMIIEDITNQMFADKKVVDGKINFVLQDGIGKMYKVSDNDHGGNYAVPCLQEIPIIIPKNIFLNSLEASF